MKRVVEPELLDALPPEDPGAIGSRRDIQRLHRIMRSVLLLRTELASRVKQPPRRIIEIGAGDGTLMLKVAERMYREWPKVQVILVDRQRVVSEKTRQRFQEFGWRAKVVVADVFKWLPRSGEADVIVANLFLHHFPAEELGGLFCLIATRAQLFVACETRRDWASFASTRSLGLIGCNAVTRHDAVKSANAGFAGKELSALWPESRHWRLTERRAKIFTHLFVAQRSAT